MSRSLSVAGLLVVCVLAGLGLVASDDEEPAQAEHRSRTNRIGKLSPYGAILRGFKANRDRDDVVFMGTFTMNLGTGDNTYRARMSIRPRACLIELRSRQVGNTVIRYIDHTAYIKPDDKAIIAAFGGTPTAVELFGGKWFEAPEDLGELEDICNAGGVWTHYTFLPACRRAGHGKVWGTRTVAFACQASKKPQRLEIATVGRPFVLRVKGKTYSGPYDLELAGVDTGFELTRPRARDVLDGSVFE